MKKVLLYEDFRREFYRLLHLDARELPPNSDRKYRGLVNQVIDGFEETYSKRRKIPAEEPVPRELAMRYDELLAYYDEFRRRKDSEKKEVVVSSKNEAKNGARLKLSQILESEMKSRFK